MLFPMGWFYDLRAYYPESVAAISLAVDALQMPDPQGLQGIVYGKALAAYGLRTNRLHGADFAEPFLQQGLEILRDLGAREDLAWPQILWLSHDGALADPRVEQYEQYCLDSLAIFEDMNDRYGAAFSLVVLGSNYRRHGRYAEAQLSIERGLAISRSLGDREGMAHALRRLGQLNWHLGRYEIARDNFQEEVALWRDLSLPRLAAEGLRSLGETYLAIADFENAGRILQESLVGFEQVGDEGNALASMLDLVSLAWQQGQPQKAQRLLQEAWPIMDQRQHGSEQAMWWSLSGRVYLQLHDVEAASLALNQALEQVLQAGDLRLIEVVLDLAELYLYQGDGENAARLIGFADARSDLPIALRQLRLEPLRESLVTACGNDELAPLYAEGAVLDKEAIARNLLTATTDR
jgi:tetratricopeptide (TPR) repeat protein